MMHCDFRRLFNPTPEEKEEDEKRARKVYDECAKERGCSTCWNCKRVKRFPGFVTAEECICIVGRECDTVMFKVKHCEKYKQRPYGEQQLHDPILDEPGVYYVV